MRNEKVSSYESSNDYDQRELQNVHPPDWKNPEPIDKYHLVVIGAGPAGLLTALNAAKVGAKVALIERDRFGGACFNVGCIPSKTIIRTSRLYAEMRDAENFGAQVPTGISVDFAAVMERMRRVRARISRRVSAQRLSSAGVDVYFGEARLRDPTRSRSRASAYASSGCSSPAVRAPSFLRFRESQRQVI
jgi:hypothetical protein